MVTKLDLKEWIVEALKAHGGCAHPIDAAKDIWVNYQDELQGAGDLRREGRLLPKSKGKGHKGPWRLT
jgi:hypothetical protein